MGGQKVEREKKNRKKDQYQIISAFCKMFKILLVKLF